MFVFVSLVLKKTFSWILLSSEGLWMPSWVKHQQADGVFRFKQVLAKQAISPFLYEKFKEEILNFLGYIISLFFFCPWWAIRCEYCWWPYWKYLGKKISCDIFSIITPSIIIYRLSIELYSRKSIFRRIKIPNPYLNCHYLFQF